MSERRLYHFVHIGIKDILVIFQEHEVEGEVEVQAFRLRHLQQQLSLQQTEIRQGFAFTNSIQEADLCKSCGYNGKQSSARTSLRERERETLVIQVTGKFAYYVTFFFVVYSH